MGNFFDFINVPLGYLIRFCYFLIPNYLLALFLFALIIKVILFPLGIKQQKSVVKQAELRPKEAAIRKRYAGRTDRVTQQKINEEIMKLYQDENYNPMSGCLPLLVQLPIIMALYTVINNPLKYLCSLSAEVISAISARVTELYNASALSLAGVTESVVKALEAGRPLTQINIVTLMHGSNFPLFADLLPAGFSESQLPDFTVFGGLLNLADVPKVELSWLTLVPVLTFVISFASMKLMRKMTYTPGMDDPNTRTSIQIMDLTMPLFSVWIAFTVPALIGIYWIYQNILSTLQQFILMKMYPLPVFTEEDYKRIEKEMNGTIRREKKKRSLHRIDEEDDEDEADEAEQPENKAAGGMAAQLIDRGELKDERDKDAGKEKGAGKPGKKKATESK
ncbi:MAG TPA: YidC/Oxa1 family membrane protein insertase [Clostridiales bacterium]|nr:YidC/Oxa1 family membrane protein insertase [Clostridiales bacterium]